MMKLTRLLILFTGFYIPFLAFSQDHKELSKVISKGGTAGEYQAFTDVVQLKNGDLLAVFYAGESHVTYPSESYPKAGRICMVRSTDEGKSWSRPITIYDDHADNRDPHISQMNDGTLIVTFFNTLFGEIIEKTKIDMTKSLAHYQGQRRVTKNGGIHYITSIDNGETWSAINTIQTGEYSNACSAPMRQLRNGNWIYLAYHQRNEEAFGVVYISTNKGRDWSEGKYIGKGEGKYLPAETDIITLKNGDILAALRGDIKRDDKLHFSISKDQGQSWGKVVDSRFQGHCPHFIRLKSGAIVLTYRAFTDDSSASSGYTGLRISYDEGKTWQGPYLIDKFWGAYASTVELGDNSLLITYYEEGNQSAVRVIKTLAPKQSKAKISYSKPEPLVRLKF